MPAFADIAIDPPLADSYRALALLRRDGDGGIAPPAVQMVGSGGAVLERDLPMVDLERLTRGGAGERKACAGAMARAASEWGFFQLTNHGVSRELMEEMRREQARLFRLPFETKEKAGLLNGSYRWGNPTATSLRHLSWSEAFHVPLASISGADCDFGDLTSLRGVMQEVAEAMSRVANTVAAALAEELTGRGGGGASAAPWFPAGCDETTCFLRLNRYPTCPFAADTFGLVPHTDSDFLTVLCQDQVGGLHLMKDSRWVAVRPRPDALVVNIGDLFQAWSNNRYKSVEHKVVANAKTDRLSVAYFLCPSYDSLVGTCGEPSPYRAFTFGEYRKKVQEDVRTTGKKIGLPNFLKHSSVQ
ncbi:gibberellin 2-beta-dioxygenase 6 [Oryza glaberrima]|uniref:gibberellin 2beta-dioxygenase n=2 Tax=Oryza TaxID=4527 RepID=A0A0D3FY22_9ORYZ|nr:gibberellin 2-beta-dioxygenase 6 [Oryza glaberrima]